MNITESLDGEELTGSSHTCCHVFEAMDPFPPLRSLATNINELEIEVLILILVIDLW